MATATPIPTSAAKADATMTCHARATHAYCQVRRLAASDLLVTDQWPLRADRCAVVRLAVHLKSNGVGALGEADTYNPGISHSETQRPASNVSHRGIRQPGTVA